MAMKMMTNEKLAQVELKIQVGFAATLALIFIGATAVATSPFGYQVLALSA
jgi:hypothetical protein